MAGNNCEHCAFRAKYDQNPKSLMGRLWRFHITFCPGWKGYMKSLDEDKRNEVKARYGLK